MSKLKQGPQVPPVVAAAIISVFVGAVGGYYVRFFSEPAQAASPGPGAMQIADRPGGMQMASLPGGGGGESSCGGGCGGEGGGGCGMGGMAVGAEADRVRANLLHTISALTALKGDQALSKDQIEQLLPVLEKMTQKPLEQVPMQTCGMALQVIEGALTAEQRETVQGMAAAAAKDEAPSTPKATEGQAGQAAERCPHGCNMEECETCVEATASPPEKTTSSRIQAVIQSLKARQEA